MACMALTTMAQETYENAQLATEDLNGTARYVGMGGAMEALGADITTINTNPAGVGMFRHSWLGVSAGFTSQQGDNVMSSLMANDGKKTNADLNQVGFVFAMPTGNNSNINMAVNYHRSRNFNQIINAVGALNDASASKRALTSMASLKNGFDPRTGDDLRLPFISVQDYLTDLVLNRNLTITEEVDPKDPLKGKWYYDGYRSASGYASHTNNRGFVNNFDFNLSGNSNDRVFWGITLGLRDVHYRSNTMYTETLVDLNENPIGDYTFNNYRYITGSGFNFKAGVIFRPVEESPFRVGLYINSPTWYTLKCSSEMRVDGHMSDYLQECTTAQQDFWYRYKMSTPWKFGASLGTTFGSRVALGLTYQFSDYSSIKNRIEGDEYVERNYGYWGVYDTYYTTSQEDREMDRNTKQSLRGVHLLKAGIEVRPTNKLSLRAGYNYETAIYENQGSKDLLIGFGCYDNLIEGSVGNCYTNYDFVNWKGTQRVTFGLGIALTKNWKFDVSYQYATQKGEYHPFQNISEIPTYANSTWGDVEQDGTISLYAPAASVKNDRHQVNMTLGYTF